MKTIRGTITALITPFLKEAVDEKSFRQLITQQLKSGVEGFVINGTTAESPTLKKEEVKKLFSIAKEMVPAHFPLLVGTGSNSTEATIEHTREAEKMGADAALVVVPYYNNPPQRGLFQHFSKIADQSQIPVVLYNVPGRTVAKLELETVVELSKHKNILGIKEASGNITFAKNLREQCRKSFVLLSGDDGTYDDFFAAGGDGVISVASHVIPQAMSQKQATKHADLIKNLFCEANPIPVKYALYLMGVIQSPELRLPLVTLSEKMIPVLREQLLKAGVTLEK